MTTEIPANQEEQTINVKESDKELTTIDFEFDAKNSLDDKYKLYLEREDKDNDKETLSSEAATDDIEPDHSKENEKGYQTEHSIDLALGAEVKIGETTEYIHEQMSNVKENEIVSTTAKDRNKVNDDLKDEMKETRNHHL